MKTILGHSSVFKYAGDSTDQVEKLILQNEANSAENIGEINYIFCLMMGLQQWL